MLKKNEQGGGSADLLRFLGGDVVLVRHGDRTYRVPSEFQSDLKIGGDEFTFAVEVVDGAPAIKAVALVAAKPMRPLDLQRLPWARLLDEVLAANVLEVAPSGAGVKLAPADLDTARRAVQRSRRPARDESLPRGRRPVTAERIQEVLDAKAEAQAQGVRWDIYAHKKLNLSPAYLRQLASRVNEEESSGQR